MKYDSNTRMLLKRDEQEGKIMDYKDNGNK